MPMILNCTLDLPILRCIDVELKTKLAENKINNWNIVLVLTEHSTRQSLCELVVVTGSPSPMMYVSCQIGWSYSVISTILDETICFLSGNLVSGWTNIASTNVVRRNVAGEVTASSEYSDESVVNNPPLSIILFQMYGNTSWERWLTLGGWVLPIRSLYCFEAVKAFSGLIVDRYLFIRNQNNVTIYNAIGCLNRLGHSDKMRQFWLRDINNILDVCISQSFNCGSL